jgi:hypothetical protein
MRYDVKSEKQIEFQFVQFNTESYCDYVLSNFKLVHLHYFLD